MQNIYKIFKDLTCTIISLGPHISKIKILHIVVDQLLNEQYFSPVVSPVILVNPIKSSFTSPTRNHFFLFHILHKLWKKLFKYKIFYILK